MIVEILLKQQLATKWLSLNLVFVGWCWPAIHGQVQIAEHVTNHIQNGSGLFMRHMGQNSTLFNEGHFPAESYKYKQNHLENLTDPFTTLFILAYRCF